MPDNAYILDSRALLEIGGILGVAAGCITFLLRQVISTKDAQLKDALGERDWYRDVVRRHLEQPVDEEARPWRSEHPRREG